MTSLPPLSAGLIMIVESFCKVFNAVCSCEDKLDEGIEAFVIL